IAKWPLIALGQKLWLRYFGTRTDGSTYTSQTYDATPVPSAGLPNGMYPNTPVAQLRGLKDGSQLRIEFKVTFDGNTDERQAVIFPSRLYTVKALEEMTPEITSVKGASNGAEIANGGSTAETGVILIGAATKGQRVEIFDGAASLTEVPVHATTGIWTTQLTGLSLASHSFTAKAKYGSEQTSTPWIVTVVGFVIDPSDMILSGHNLTTRGSGLNWEVIGDPVGTSDVRLPTSGIPPCTFSTSNSAIASVDPSTGIVRSEGNGTARITVSDAQGGTGSFEVKTSNVHQLMHSTAPMSGLRTNAWITSLGGRKLIHSSFPDLVTLNAKYRGPKSYTYMCGDYHVAALLVYYAGNQWLSTTGADRPPLCARNVVL
ncbi:hypothetical protein ACQKP4_28315, partial [Pseudomonas sp. NPDC086278]